MACCRCCEKTGACCVPEEGCSQKTCAECEDADGLFQGVDTVCDDDECPCAPPARPPACEKCEEGAVVGYCGESDCCVDTRCRPCPEPTCPAEPCDTGKCCTDGYCVTCPCPSEPCTGTDCCVDGVCIPCPEYDCDPACTGSDCCVDGVCVPCEACTPGSCPAGQCCVDGFCTDCPDPPGDPCSPGSCPSGECCINGYCVPCPPEQCPDSPCPSGECCIDGYCINPCGEGRYCCDGECQDEPCEAVGACCDDDGTCSQTTEGDCSGTWHEGVDCEDIDCESGCCEGVSSPNGNCFYFTCVRGEKDNCTPCDPEEPQPQEPVPACDGGTPASVTVTGSGYVANSGTQPLDDDLNRIMNDSYVVDLTCNGAGSLAINDSGYLILVNVAVALARGASIVVFAVAGMTLSPAQDTPTTTDCGADSYPCGGYSGAVTGSSGIGDFSGADIDVSV